MMAQDPLKFNIEFHEGGDELFQIQDDDPEKVLSAYQRRAFLAYQWGVWT